MRKEMSSLRLWAAGCLLAGIGGFLAAAGCVLAADGQKGKVAEVAPAQAAATDPAPAAGAPKDAPAKDTPAAASQESGTAKAEFQRIFTQFKSLLTKIRALEQQYQLAPAKERADIEAQFNKLVSQGNEIAPQLEKAAEAAYAAEPNADKEVATFLYSTLVADVDSDHYDDALRVAKLLIDGKFPDKVVYGPAGIAAFSSNRFDLGKQYLTEAKAAGRLDSKRGQELLDLVGPYQEYWAQEQKLREAEAKADDLPRVKMQTSKGDIVIELFENEAPNATANFISLVESHFYDGLPFHRVIPGFMAQGGDPKGNGSGGPGYTIACECREPNHRMHFAGSLSMAHAGPDTGGSQFFLTFVPTAHLNGKHTVFGRVIEGMDILAELQRTEGGHAPQTPDKIIKATVLRKRDHKYVPVKGPAR